MSGKISTPGIASTEEAVRFPDGLHNAFLFAAFNALSFQMILSSPMVLYAKSLGASATILGIIAGMMPLLVIFQIPAAYHIPRYGYKRFVYAGWGTRVMFIFFMAFVPLTGRFLTAETRIGFMLFLLFGFNLSRGISSAAWLPWISSLVPPSIRGKYLTRDAACVNLASAAAFLLAAQTLRTDPAPWQFSIVFGFSAIMGSISLFYLKRIPEGETPEAIRVSAEPVPWRALAGHLPFRKLLRVNMAWSIAYGGLTTFTVAFLKTEAGMTEDRILLAVSASFIGGLASLWFIGSRLDDLGSKPVLTFSFLSWIAIVSGWLALSGGLLAPNLGVVLVLQALMGLGASLVSMANTRLVMAVIPSMGRNHFFALYSVVSNLTLGLAPILWGLLLDALRPLARSWHGFEWNRYSIFFLSVAGGFVVTVLLSRRLHEPEAVRMEELLREIFIQAPQRAWVRLWPRV